MNHTARDLLRAGRWQEARVLLEQAVATSVDFADSLFLPATIETTRGTPWRTVGGPAGRAEMSAPRNAVRLLLLQQPVHFSQIFLGEAAGR